jgi:hypothetical protein
MMTPAYNLVRHNCVTTQWQGNINRYYKDDEIDVGLFSPANYVSKVTLTEGVPSQKLP